MFFSVYTLGCKLNQVESEAITDSFCREGFTFVPWDTLKRRPALSSAEPWLMVINTCTVTSMAEQKARRFIRRLLREHSAMCVIITGCYAQVEQAELAALEPSGKGEAPLGPGRLFVIPGDSKDRLLDLPRLLAVSGNHETALPHLISSWLDSLSINPPPADSPPKGEDGSFRLQPENFASHSRAFLKVQDGCDKRCAYCRVSIARGKSRSLGAAEALTTLKALEKRGFAEAVIAGVNITQYHDSLPAALELDGLLGYLLAGTETIRLRLSSLEPDWLTPARLAEFSSILAHPRVRPHFHLSVQSGSAGIIAKMARSYTPADIERAAEMFRSVRNDPFLACDIIAGFPGETEEDFAKTLSLCERIGFAWIHAFPFSPRPGTAARDFPERVSERDTATRVQQLTELARKGRREYIARWEGKEVEAVVEAVNERLVPEENLDHLPRRMVPAVSENYLKLLIISNDSPPPGSLIRCRISGGKLPADPRFDAIAEIC